MPRTARLAYENAFYHVFNRGLDKRPIFHDPSDYQYFLRRLQELTTKKRYDHAIYTYVLMPNHFHLLLQTKKAPLAKVMTSLLTSYSMYFNRKYRRVGTLFQNRFKSKLCDRDSYFLGASRYIHLNPLAARLTRDLKDYPWSSYQELFGNSGYAIISRADVIRLIGESLKERESYRQFLLDGIDQFKELEKDYTFEREAEGPPRFTTLAQKKYLRRRKGTQ